MKLLTVLLVGLLFVSCSEKNEDKASEKHTKVSERGLSVGAEAPQITALDVDGKMFELKKAVLDGPVVLVFYRGGWCPYCSTQLRGLQSEALPEITKAGGKLVAISVDKMESALKTKEKESLGMTVLSDPKAEILKAYDVDYKVPDELAEAYIKKYKIDLEAHSGQDHHIIAVPAVYVIDKNSKITFAYVNENYKVRAQVSDILGAVKAL